MDKQERIQRLTAIAVEMDKIVKELGPKWIRLAHLRTESQQIIQELRDADRQPGT